MNDIILKKIKNYFKGLLETFGSDRFTPMNGFMMLVSLLWMITLFFPISLLSVNLFFLGGFMLFFILLIIINLFE